MMERNQPYRGPAAPDDRRNYDGGNMFAQIAAYFAVAKAYPARVLDSQFRIQDNGDTTKQTAFEVSGITTATTRTLTVQDADGTIALVNQLTWHHHLDPFVAPASATNWSTFNVDTAAIGNGRRTSTGAQNAVLQWNNVLLAAGTWSCNLLHVKNTDRGQYQLQLNGTNASGFTVIEGYNAALVYNTLSVQSFTVATTGLYNVSFIMATKNAASTNYFGDIQKLEIVRTA